MVGLAERSINHISQGIEMAAPRTRANRQLQPPTQQQIDQLARLGTSNSTPWLQSWLPRRPTTRQHLTTCDKKKRHLKCCQYPIGKVQQVQAQSTEVSSLVI